MFEISKDFLISEAISNKSYNMGVLLANNGSVTNIKFDLADMIIRATVKDRGINNVYAEFSSDGHLQYNSCNCADFRQWRWHCKHITATMIKIINLEKNGCFDKELSKRNINKFIGNMNKEKRVARIPLKFEINIEYNKSNNLSEHEAKVWFKIGEKRLYVAKDIGSFVESVVQKEKYEFGKNFTFNPNTNKISDDDQEIFDFIKRIVELDKLIKSRNPHYGNYGFIEKKHIYLTDTMLTELLEIINNRKFNFIYNEDKFNDITIKESNINCNFNIEKSDGDISIKVDSKIFQSGSVILIPGGNYIFADGEMLKISENRSRDLKQVDELLLGIDNNILVESDKAEEVLSLLYPILKKVGEVTVDTSI